MWTSLANGNRIPLSAVPAGRHALQARCLEPRLEEVDAVVAPELLAAEEEDRDAEHVVGVRLLLRALVVAHAFGGEVPTILGGGEAELGDECRHGVRLVGLE